MGNRDAEAIRIAQERHLFDNDIDIDHEPELSHADDGIWVSAWVWVSDDELPDEDEDEMPAHEAAWESFGGPLIDKVEDGELTVEEAADLLLGEYGDLEDDECEDWEAYVRRILSDRGATIPGKERA